MLLHLAAFLGCHQVVRSIITDDNAGMNGLDRPMHTFLTISSKTKFGDIISILLQVRVEVDFSKKSGRATNLRKGLDKSFTSPAENILRQNGAQCFPSI